MPCDSPQIVTRSAENRNPGKRQFCAYCGLALEARSSADYQFVVGELRRSKKPVLIRGLNQNHNHNLKNIFKAAATTASALPRTVLRPTGPWSSDGMVGLQRFLDKVWKPVTEVKPASDAEPDAQQGERFSKNGIRRYKGWAMGSSFRVQCFYRAVDGVRIDAEFDREHLRRSTNLGWSHPRSGIDARSVCPTSRRRTMGATRSCGRYSPPSVACI
jgi:hypothetical protein